MRMRHGEENGVELPPRAPVSVVGSARQRLTKAGAGHTGVIIPEEDFSIPTDGNVSAFTVDSMASLLRCLGVEERLVSHLHRQGLDGRRFGRLKDSDMEHLQLKNPVTLFFRDRSAPPPSKGKKQRSTFVL